MSLQHSPKIVTDGLVFYYDMQNSTKSWQGKPTTNYISIPTEEMTRGEFGQYRDLAPIFNNYGLVPYSLSMDIKVNKPGSVYVYMQNGSTTRYSFVAQWVSATTSYKRFTFNNITPSISNSSDTQAMLATYTTYGSGVNPTVRNIQLEQGTYATPFVSGSRSSIQSLLDITQTRTITPTSLTYNSDGSFSFDGSSDYMSFPYTQSSPNNFTVEAWIYHTAHSSDTNIGHQIVIPYSNYNGWIFSLAGPSSYLLLRGHNYNTQTNPYNVSYGTGLSLNTWYHVAATDDGVNVRLYVNGVNVTTASSGVATTNTPMTAYVGCWAGISSTAFAGKIPNVKIYSRALTSAEIQQNFNCHRGMYGL